MDIIKIFDQKIMKNYGGDETIKKFLRYLLEVIVYMISCITIENLSDEGFIIFFVDVIILLCMNIYMFPFLMVKENGLTVSLGNKLKYTPVDVDMMAKDRRIKLWKYVLKTVTIITVLQFLSGLIFGVGDWLLMALLPVSLFVILAAAGHYSIYYFIRKLT